MQGLSESLRSTANGLSGSFRGTNSSIRSSIWSVDTDALSSTGPTPRSSYFGPQRHAQGWLAYLLLVVGLIVGVLIGCGVVFYGNTLGLSTSHLWRASGTSSTDAHAQTLVLYVFSASDPQYESNLRYFIREGVREDDGCDYVFVMNLEDADEMPALPTLPSNVIVMRHQNECFDWGTFGWALDQLGEQAVNSYLYYIFMNSSVRGPFMPAYVKGRAHWSWAFLDRLSPSVKLVGPTISCEAAPFDVPALPSTKWRHNPHVQSYLVATDRTGFQILRNARTVFKCYARIKDTIWYSELGSSAVVLKAGYNIDSLMVRYQSVDWRERRNWNCNERVNPYKDYSVDGVNTELMEVIFVKVKQADIDKEARVPLQALKYDEWTAAIRRGSPAVHGNVLISDAAKYKLKSVLAEIGRSYGCFDCADYRKAVAGKYHGAPCAILYQHWINYGQFDTSRRRSYDLALCVMLLHLRYTCPAHVLVTR